MFAWFTYEPDTARANNKARCVFNHSFMHSFEHPGGDK